MFIARLYVVIQSVRVYLNVFILICLPKQKVGFLRF